MPIAAELYYFAHEAEDRAANRPPVLLIHGAGGNHLSWPPQIRRLDDERVYALDLPGHGKSEGIGRHSIDEYANEVIEFMKVLKLRAAVMIGISMGTAIALTIALKFPKKVLGLGLVGGGARMPVAKEILETAGNPNTFESAVDMINENCFSSHASQELIRLSKQYFMQIRPPVLLGDFLACNEFDVSSRLDKINIPTLIVSGAEDKMMPVKYSEFLRDGIVNSHFHLVDNAGHMVMAEQPDIVADLLKPFIDNLPKTTSRRVELKGKAESAQ